MRYRFVYGVTTILAATAVYICWRGLSLIWDGAHQLCCSLIHQYPYSYAGRLHSYFLWIPAVLASRHTTNTWLLQFIYGLPFCLAPAVGLLASWWVVRRHAPWLIVWAIFGVAAAPLPGQVFMINDSIFQQHMFWPVFLGMLVPLTSSQRIVLPLLALFQLSHPMGIVLMLGAAGAAVAVAVLGRGDRRGLMMRAGLAATLAAACVIKLRALPDPYAAQEFGWKEAASRWHNGVAGYPFFGICCMWLSGLLLLAREWWFHGEEDQTVRQWIGAVALAGIVTGGAIWVFWASDAHRWRGALDYRRWLVPLTAPFFALAILEACRRPTQSAADHAPASRFRAAAGYLLAATFAIVLCTQATLFSSLTRRLMGDVADYPGPVVPASAVAWTKGTALDHWGTASYVILMQGQRPQKMLLDDATRQALHVNRGLFPLAPFSFTQPAPGRRGWYDFRPLMAQLNDIADAQR